MKIWLGLQLDSASCLPGTERSGIGEQFFMPRAFVQWLETFYGLQHLSGNVDYLRSEQYRQLCLAQLKQQPDVFYAKAFKADQRAAAEELLSRRDELISAAYPLSTTEVAMPPRIKALADIEWMMLDPDNSLDLRAGFADRIFRLTVALKAKKHPVLDIQLHEPLEWLPPGLVGLLAALEATGSTVNQISPPIPADSDTDLGKWRNKIMNETGGQLTASGDGSLVILRATRETHLAAFLAKMFNQNTDWKPNLLLSERNQTLNNALTMEGLPDLGVPVSSLARPSLQVLKLVTSFLWNPVDLRKILEFLNLIVKPFDHHFAQRLATSLSDAPGLHGPKWNKTVAYYLNNTLPKRAEYERKLDVEKVKEQYKFWFGRKRYEQYELIPKSEVRSLFTFLLNWSREEQAELNGANLITRQILAAQCQRLVELIDTLPEGDLTYLETERLVRTVYEPTPTTFYPAELGHLPVAYSPASVYTKLGELIWWDFTEQDPNYFFSRWTSKELEHLASVNIHPLSPKQKSDRQLWQQLRPVLHTQKRLVLCLSDYVDGEEALPHPLMGDLEAAFGDDLKKLIVNVDSQDFTAAVLSGFSKPDYHHEPLHPLPLPRKGIEFNSQYDGLEREYETPTSLEKLLYYPHQYIFQDGLKLKTNKLLSIAADNRLLGNLGHRMIENMLKEKGSENWNRKQTHRFVDDFLPALLQQEGAPLLEYGREPERVQFQQSMQQACWSLNTLLQDNHWKVKGTEVALEGLLQDKIFKGRADLLLERGKELAIIDLKWKGKTTFRNLVNNQEDLQLALYASVEASKYEVVHTAYFIISDGLMIARNDLAFKGIEAVSPDEDHVAVRDAVLQKIKATYDWRKEQIAKGWLETRMEKTAGELEDHYQDELDLLDLLEMKDGNARWDDYWTLIGGLE